MWLNDHIWENHILFKEGKSSFFSKETALYAIETCLTRDSETRVYFKKAKFPWEDDREVLVRAFPHSLGTGPFGHLMSVAKVVITAREGILVTAFLEYHY